MLPVIENMIFLGPVPGLGALHSLHFLLELQEPIHEGLSSRRASRHININRNNPKKTRINCRRKVFFLKIPVTSPDNRIRVVVVTTSIGTTAHAHNPTWFRHLKK